MIENIIELIYSLIELPESPCLEFKENNKDPSRIGKYISALSNMAALEKREYSYLVYGISDSTRAITGTKLDLSLEMVGNQKLEFWLNNLIYPKAIFDYDSALINGKKITVIRVRRAIRSTTSFDGNEYARINESLVDLKNQPDLRRRLWTKILFTIDENNVCLDSIKEEDISKYLNIRQYYSLLKKEIPTNFNEVLSRLLNEGFIKKRDDNRFSVTVLGMLCIATSFSYVPSLSGSKIEIVKYETESRVSSTSTPIIYDKGYLFSFEEIINLVTNIMGKKETVKGGLRIIEEEIPSLIVRELLSNAMIHQNLNPITTHILIECFPTRMEIYSPGKMAIDPKRVLDMAPMPENRHLVEVLSRFGIGEGHGTGYDKIIETTEEYMLPAPTIKIEDYGTRVIVYKRKNWSSYDEEEKLAAIYNHVSLKYVNNQKATNESIRNRFGLKDTNKAQISRLISKAIQENLIKKSSDSTGARNTTYLPYWA